MPSPFDRLFRFFSEPIYPATAFQLARTYVSGLRFSKKEKKVAAHFVLPLPAGVLEPSFDRKNIVNAAALDKALREGKARLREDGGAVALLIPETCVRMFVLSFDSLPSSPTEREEVLRWRLSKIAPFKAEEIRIAYDIVRSGSRTKAVLALSRIDVIQEYESFLGRLGLKVKAVGVPSLHLANLIRLDQSGHALLVNIEEDYVSLLAVLEGLIALYRIKPFLQDAGSPMSPGQKTEQVLNEIENTLHFLEDREQKNIQAVWVRAAAANAANDVLPLMRERWPGLNVREFSSPVALKSHDQHVLFPLIGQALS